MIHHHIDIIIPRPLRGFVDSILSTADRNGVHMIMANTRHVQIGGMDVNGYFGDKPRPTLAVACGQPIDKWLPLLVHESCHMDQFLEKSPCWIDATINEVETVSLIDLWINRQIELLDWQLTNIADRSLMVELDCEKRSVEKIKKYDLPIDTVEYTKKANAYIYFYLVLRETRCWYPGGREPYNVEPVWSVMPDHFDNDYTQLPVEIRNAFKVLFPSL